MDPITHHETSGKMNEKLLAAKPKSELKAKSLNDKKHARKTQQASTI